MNLLQRIKEETKTNHQNVEKVLVEELKNLASLDAYASLLERLHAFYNPIEKKLQTKIKASVIPDISARQHVENLRKDIEIIRKNAVVTNETTSTVHIENTSYALGVLYVIEGSTLGGQIITKMLDKHLSVSTINANNYFNSYGDNTPEMWSKFKNYVLNPTLKIDQELMIQGAKDIFASLQNHLLQTKS
ncbi:biliverdin-producing heme oxygenase [Kordia algicida OT-1]|uniref:Heme oxygenase n=1 Tax=Kordia algicida OT-1 TaxID=391587 RepID=A9E8I8_9FLAO|nr:biliverdin-producing heme oxygenase [Kordia algicida]EDP94777.1 Heme oxygenase [Kordia algicida OT-1]